MNVILQEDTKIKRICDFSFREKILWPFYN